MISLALYSGMLISVIVRLVFGNPLAGVLSLRNFHLPEVQSFKSGLERFFAGIPTLVVTVFDGTGIVFRKPAIRFVLPVFRQFVVVLQPPSRISDVCDGRFVLTVGVIFFIENWVLGETFSVNNGQKT